MQGVLSCIVVSHLERPGARATVVDAVGDLPESWRRHEAWDPAYAARLDVYKVDTFAQLLVLVKSLPPCLLVVHGFHELLELYRLELSAAYHETILRHQLNRNAAILAGEAHSEIPPNSDLLKESPVLKFQRHAEHLVAAIAAHAINDSVCFLTGCLDTKYQGYTPLAMSSQTAPSSDDRKSQGSRGRLVFTPTSSAKVLRGRNTDLLDPFVTKRAIFYKNWYHLSQPPAALQVRDLRLVSCCKVYTSERSSVVYFDYSDGKLTDLSKPDPEDVSIANFPSSPNVVDSAVDTSAVETPVEETQVVEDSQEIGTLL